MISIDVYFKLRFETFISTRNTVCMLMEFKKKIYSEILRLIKEGFKG